MTATAPFPLGNTPQLHSPRCSNAAPSCALCHLLVAVVVVVANCLVFLVDNSHLV